MNEIIKELKGIISALQDIQPVIYAEDYSSDEEGELIDDIDNHIGDAIDDISYAIDFMEKVEKLRNDKRGDVKSDRL